MKKTIFAVLLGLATLTSTSVQANEWGDWGGKKKGRVSSAAICGLKGYIFTVNDMFYVAKHQSGKRFAVGVPVKARFGKGKWLKVEGLKNSGLYTIKGKYFSLKRAKAKACGLGW